MQPMPTDHDLATWLQQQRLAHHAQPEPRHSVRLRGELQQKQRAEVWKRACGAKAAWEAREARGSTKAQLTFSTDFTRPIMTASRSHHAVLGDDARASGALKPEDLSGCRTHLSACGLRHIPAVILTDAAAVTGQPAAQHGTERPAAQEKTVSEPGTIF